MKKVISLIMVFALVFAFAGCGASVDDNTDSTTSVTEAKADTEETTAEKENETTAENKTLVVYFSRTGEQYGVGVIEKGNTAIVADMIVEQTGADSFEILPKEDNYPMTYDALTDYAKEEQNNNARPAIKDEVENFDSYDTVFIGYPIWWGDMPMICYTFLESYDFSGKTVIPFCTHAGSGNAGTQSKIQSVIPDAEVKEVLAITGTATQNDQDSVRSEVTEWLNNLGFNE
ncbi:MAG: NAD(P)H-dependent oxidoreductase [Ruminococcus sp.]|nr:NAD(P)H-dependent oxidoreductase [Ruminococcus sp.]